MRNVQIFLLFLCAASGLGAADFRNAVWGMTPAQVKKAETAKLANETESILVYSATLGGQPVAIGYLFEDGRLAAAEYNFLGQHRETEKYIQDYDAMQNLLEKKYGAPSAKEQLCDDVFYAGFPHRWGTAVVVGKMSRLSVWNAHGGMIVKHSMRALPGGNVGHKVQYEPVGSAKSSLDSAEVLGAL